MAMLLLSFIIYFTAHSVLANNNCKIGKAIVQDVDMNQIIFNSWKWVFINNKQLLAQYSCREDKIGQSIDGVAFTQCSHYGNSDGHNSSFSGSFYIFDGHFVNFTLPGNDNWSSTYEILALEYGRFVIAGGCPKAIGGQSVVIMLFLSWKPCKDDLNAAKEALSKTGLNFEDFQLFCPLSKTQ
ncbi:uncharacterized protein [Periplaneta americana]|uniref:uncharacterized protein n=1 Tax=Periplaneta americana TaxID=6978 RepID=UPI0037E75784